MDTILKFIKELLSKLPKWLKIVVSVLCGVVLSLYLIFGLSSCESTKYHFKSNGYEMDIEPKNFDADVINDKLIGIYERTSVNSLWELRYDDMNAVCVSTFGMSYSDWLDYVNQFGYSYDGTSIKLVEVI